MSDNELHRDPVFEPLSRDHGVLLVLAQRLRKAAAGSTKDRTCLAGEFTEKLANIAEQYLNDETEALLSVDIDVPIRDEIVSEHAKLIEAMNRLGGGQSSLSPARFNALADLIEGHVRWDERRLLPFLERQLKDSDRAKLAERTSSIDARHVRPIKELHHSIMLNKASGHAETCTCAESVEKRTET